MCSAKQLWENRDSTISKLTIVRSFLQVKVGPISDESVFIWHVWSFCATFWWLAYRWQKSPPAMAYMPERKDLFWKTACKRVGGCGTVVTRWWIQSFTMEHSIGILMAKKKNQKASCCRVLAFSFSVSVVCSSTGTERGVLAWKDAASPEDNDGYRGACWCRFFFF